MVVNYLEFDIVSRPTVSVIAFGTQIVGQSLMLECNVMRITSGVDIVWTTVGSEVQRVSRANSTMYTDIFNIVLRMARNY